MLPGTGAKAETVRNEEDLMEVCGVGWRWGGDSPDSLWDRASAGHTAGVPQAHTAFSGLCGSQISPQLAVFFS